MENQELEQLRKTLLEQAKTAPTDPGVYLMKDSQGTILYVGKAKNLKNRVSSYFARSPHEIPRIEIMVSRVKRFDMILTETEDEALILECTLIKKHKPKFNVRLKDDKAFPYLKIDQSQDYPRIEWTRRVLKDGARYFGPFPSSWSAKSILRLLNERFKLRDCSDNTFRHRSRPCILYQMDRCTAPCVQKISVSDYQGDLQKIIQTLEGKDQTLETELKQKMTEAAENMEYELAAYYRDQLNHLGAVTAIQAVDEAGSHRNRDVVALEESQVAVLKIRGGRLIAVKHLSLQNVETGAHSQPDADLLADFLGQFYLAQKSDDEQQEIGPQEILVSLAPNDPSGVLERTLGISIRLPETELEKRLVSVAKTNVKHALEQAKKKPDGHGLQALEEVQHKLHLDRLPSRIECFDNSNFQGDDAVASRVVFIDGAPDKNLYRRYKIKTVTGANDFATMKEVLGRRFSNTQEDLPDLVVVDGGKGQLSQAVAIMEELGVQGVAVVGLAKARTESDFRKTEVESTLERIFIPGRKNPVNLLPHTAAYKLLTHVRDEAHRFAIQYHRLLRDGKKTKH